MERVDNKDIQRTLDDKRETKGFVLCFPWCLFPFFSISKTYFSFVTMDQNLTEDDKSDQCLFETWLKRPGLPVCYCFKPQQTTCLVNWNICLGLCDNRDRIMSPIFHLISNFIGYASTVLCSEIQLRFLRHCTNHMLNNITMPQHVYWQETLGLNAKLINRFEERFGSLTDALILLWSKDVIVENYVTDINWHCFCSLVLKHINIIELFNQ